MPTHIGAPDFSRRVVCILGLPFDAVSLGEAVDRVCQSVLSGDRTLVSTVNVNFVVAAQRDELFRHSVIHSELSLADGMPIVWISRFLGMPVVERVPGSSLFKQLQSRRADEPVRVYFFGGLPGVAERAAQRINASKSGVRCVGFEDPGHGTAERLSSEDSIRRINAAKPDFLVVSLGAVKGQAWIERNRPALEVPVLSHLGAVVGFEAGMVRRAPRMVQASGFEWLWRIREEPALWRRYLKDGKELIRLLLVSVIPLAAIRVRGLFWPVNSKAIAELNVADNATHLTLGGMCGAGFVESFNACLRAAAEARSDVVIDLKNVDGFDANTMGSLLLLYGHQRDIGHRLLFAGVTARIRRVFRRHCTEYLLHEQFIQPPVATAIRT